MITLTQSHLTRRLVCDPADDPLDPLHPDLELHCGGGEADVLSPLVTDHCVVVVATCLAQTHRAPTPASPRTFH